MAQLTLVPATLARPGHTFTFLGPNDGGECDGCPVRGICFRLEPGRRYRVTSLRDVEHPCKLHDEGRVRVCEVEEVPLRTSLETRHLRGTAARWDPVPCDYPECAHFALCHPIGARPGRHVIKEDHGPLECPMGYDIHTVTLTPLHE